MGVRRQRQEDAPVNYFSESSQQLQNPARVSLADASAPHAELHHTYVNRRYFRLFQQPAEPA